MRVHPLAGSPGGKPQPRGFQIAYHAGETNHCPGCGRQQWLVGRLTAECVFCHTALPMDHVDGYGYAPRFEAGSLASGLPLERRPVY